MEADLSKEKAFHETREKRVSLIQFHGLITYDSHM